MKPPPPHKTANASTATAQASEAAFVVSVAAGLHLDPQKTLTLAPQFSVDQGIPGNVLFRIKKVRRPATAGPGDGNEFAAGEIVAGDPNPKDGRYRKAWVLIHGLGQPRLVRLSVIESDGTSELPLQLVVAKDYATHFYPVRDGKGRPLSVLFAAANGESIEIRATTPAQLIVARHQALRETRSNLLARSSSHDA